jgi:tetratricopeptide (TPR) repeat protein
MPRFVTQIARIAAALWIVSHSAEAQSAKKQDPPVATAGLTANELFEQARTLFNQKNYKDALEAYLKFRAEFSTSPDAAKALQDSLYPLAMCFVQQSRFAEAVPAITEALEAKPPLSPQQVQELTFWVGTANLQIQDYAAARAALEKFIALFPPGAEKNSLTIRQNPAAARLTEARMLVGTSWILEQKYSEAADYYAALKPSLSPEIRGRAVIYQLHALLQLGDNDAAMAVVNEEFPRMQDIPQLISFQTLTLQLGNRWLENGEFRKAIICLQRVWPRERLLKHQAARLEELRTRQAAVGATDDSYQKILYTRLVNEVQREMENFQKIENFDTALRFRLAVAYLHMKRHREAALSMSAMLKELPPDKLTEQAAINVVRCWSTLEDWPQTIETAKEFTLKFPESPLLPQVYLMQAEALQSSLRYDEAATAFEEIAKRFPNSESAPRASFLKAFSLLQAEKNADAAKAFEDFLTRYPKHSLADSGAYWLGMTYSFDKQFEKCRELMDAYLQNHPKGLHMGSAVFRKAYCSQQLERYGTAVDELHDYLEKFPGEPENSEARVLLGNALMNEGFVPEGIAAFREIPATDTKPYEEGVFRTAEALKLLEDYEQYRTLMQDFAKNHPRSPRVAEAIANLGWYYRKQEQPAKAREIYWQAIRDHGNDPEIRSVDDLFPSLARLYRGPAESAEYLALLGDLLAEAAAEKKDTLRMRLLHAQAQTLKKSDPKRSQALLVEAAALADVREANPALLVDFANALLESGQTKQGEEMLRDALRWNPRAMQKDRILAALGELELKNGNEKAALDWFNRFERENLGTQLFAPTMLSKAKLLQKRGRLAEARRVLEEVLKNEATSGEKKAETLCLIGDLHMAEENPKLAIPYYQRVYLMHGRWRPWVARAYARSGEAFEKIQDSTAARRTYSEFLSKTELEDFPESKTAQARLQALGGPLPSKSGEKTNPSEDSPEQG